MEQTMKTTTEILEMLNRNSLSHQNEIFTRLYRYLLRPDAYYLAYKNLYANDGASTAGMDPEDTADGFSEEKISNIIESLKDGSYEPKPVRRSYIKKKSNTNKKRPLGLPVFTDKLIQEIIKMLLEAIYEPVFSSYSHGFRPNRSCHTALNSIKYGFNGTRWFIEGDIKGCFDNINHDTLITILGKKIKDAKLLQLIRKFLKAGYMDNWQYHNTYSGTPQGGIVSPILANIYLNEFDKFVEQIQKSFNKPRTQKFTDAYNKTRHRIDSLHRKIKDVKGKEREELISQYKAAQKVLRSTPCTSKTDKRLCYVRYADDFLIGVCGSKEECEKLKINLSEFIAVTLHMELSEEKTLITHSNEHARFLSYDVRTRRDNTVRKSSNGTKKRAFNNKMELNIPLKEKIESFLLEKDIAIYRNGRLMPVHCKHMLRLTPLEIISAFNSELRGVCNYYGMSSNFESLQYFAFLMEYSCLKTLAARFNTSVKKIRDKYKDGHGSWGIPYSTKSGSKCRYFAKFRECKDNIPKFFDVKTKARLHYSCARNSLEERLKAHVCELCGKVDAQSYQLHHISKVKDLKGKALWEQCMIAKRRKTLVVCKECHYKIHNGNRENKD